MRKEHTEFQHLWSEIGSSDIMVLSTCADNRVTSRPMSVVVIDGKFCCQTDRRYLKCSQIKANPNVALCVNNFSIEGQCHVIGRPLENSFFVEKMKECFPDAVSRWSELPTECVLEITPKLISAWSYDKNKPFIERWDFESISYVKEIQV